MANSTAVSTQQRPQVLVHVEARAQDIASLNPQMDSKRVLATFTMACRKDPKILTCSPQSVLEAVSKATADGLMIDGREAAIQVRKGKVGKDDRGKDVWGQVAVYVPMYQGLLKRARNSGDILNVVGAFIVYENEVAKDADGKPVNPAYDGGFRFRYERGDNESIFHDPILFEETGKPAAVYSIVKLRGGEVSREVMTWPQVMAIKNRNVREGKDERTGKTFLTGLNPVWDTDEEEMSKKTCIRRHSKKLPLSSDMSALFANLDEAEPHDFDGETIDEQGNVQAPKATKQRGTAASRVAEAKRQQQAEAHGADKETGEIQDAEVEDVSGDTGPAEDAGDGPGEDGEADYF